MTLENVLRGSGDIGAMLCTTWGLKQIHPATNSIYIANVKPRDFQPCEPFIIQGRPSLDQTGYFEMTHPPGYAGSLSDHAANVGRPAMADKEQKAAQARQMKEQAPVIGKSPSSSESALGRTAAGFPPVGNEKGVYQLLYGTWEAVMPFHLTLCLTSNP